MTILKVDEITYNANFQLTLEKKGPASSFHCSSDILISKPVSKGA